MSDYPYLGKAIMRFKSPHATDLSFEADQFVRILGPAPEDGDWATGETLDGKKGIFPKDFVEKTDEQPPPEATMVEEAEAAGSSPSPLASAPPAEAAHAPSHTKDDPSSQPTPAVDDESPSAGDKTPVESSPISIPAREAKTPLPPSNSPPPADLAPISTSLLPPPIDTHVPETSPAPSVPSSVHSPPTVLTDTPSLSTRPSFNDSQLGPSADEDKRAPAPPAEAAPTPTTSTPAAPKIQPQETPSAVKVGGMSASDAKESITRGGGSLKDRMAAFQQKAAAPAPPPPVPRGKPGNWVWKNKAAGGAEAGATAPAVGDAPAASSSPSAAPALREPAVSTPSPTRPAAGAMSASDAKESITKSGGSLKERMAALQGAGAFGEPEKAKSPPVPSGKPKVWKRPEPVAAPQPEVVEEKKKSKWTVEDHKSDDEGAGGVEKTGKALVPDEAAGEGDATEEAAEEPVAEENDEEAAERARRAAIAARMAKIGARGPMGMMKAPPPPPPVKRQPSIEPPATSPDVERDEPKPTALPGLAATSTETPFSPENSAAGLAPLPAMPRRAAPPRRKPQKSTSSGAGSAAPAPVVAEGAAEEEEGHGHPAPVNPAEVPEEKTETEVKAEEVKEEVGKSEQGAQGAAIAGIALAPVGETKSEEAKADDKPAAGADVPVDEDAQAELTKVDPAVEHKEKTLAVVDEPKQAPLVASPAQEIPPPSGSTGIDIPDPAAGHHHRRESIPLPARDASYHEQDVEFREFKKGDIGIPIHSPEHIDDEPRSRDATKSGEVEEAIDDEPAQGTPEPQEKKRSLPPVPVAEEEEQEAKDSSPESTPPPPPPRSLPQIPPPVAAVGGYDTAGENTANDEEAGPLLEEEAEVEEEEEPVVHEDEAPPPPPRRTSAVPPLPKIAAALAAVDPEQDGPSASMSDAEAADAVGSEEEDVEEDVEPEQKQEEEEAPPPPPPARRPTVPVPVLPALATVEPSLSPASPTSPRLAGRPAVPMGFNSSPVEASAEETAAAPSPLSRQASVQVPSAPSAEESASHEDAPEAQDEQDEEQARRQTIAARMAKLGGANQMRMFGGPPPAKKPSRDASKDSAAGSTVEDAPAPTSEVAPPAESEPAAAEDEDEEAADKARRARALAKMGSMGGVRFGMGGFGAAPAPPPREPSPDPEPEQADEDDTPPPPPPARAPVPAVPAAPAATASEREHDEDVEEHESEDETAPPPPPARQPSIPATRALPQPPSAAAPILPMQHFGEPISLDHDVQNEDDEAPPPPPPARPARGLPALNTDSPTARSPQLQQDEARSPSSPSAPERRSSMKRFSGLLRGASRSSLDEQARPSLDEQAASRPHDQHPSSRSASQTIDEAPEQSRDAPSGGQGPSGTELAELSRTLGSAVARNAESLVGHSKKAVIADGTSLGFVTEALYQSHCNPPSQDGTSFGHLVIHQSGSSLLARRDDIRVGDIVTLSQASFKGKKGLASYSTDVGHAVGVVLEFESKKAKLKVAQAAGRANHYPTLESVSYRLEDLKSGDVQVFRPTAA